MTTVLTGRVSCALVGLVPPYDKRKRDRDRAGHGRGTSVVVGEAVLESVGGRKPTAGPTAPASRPIRPSEIRVGEAVVEPPPSTLRDAERRRYGKSKSRY